MTGSFDSAVHISEEASNAAVAVPWGIVLAIGVAGILGWGKSRLDFAFYTQTLMNAFYST